MMRRTRPPIWAPPLAMPGAPRRVPVLRPGLLLPQRSPTTEAAVTGWQAVTAALSDYASKAREIGGDIGQSLVGAFQSAENAVGEFVKTGKLNFRDLVTSLLADLAKLAARRFILGPIANALSGALGGAGGIFRRHPACGRHGRIRRALADGPGDGLRGGAPDAWWWHGRASRTTRFRRSCSGASGCSPGVRRRPTAAGGGVNVTIMARDAESFRQSRTQVAADIARAVSLGRRGM